MPGSVAVDSSVDSTSPTAAAVDAAATPSDWASGNAYGAGVYAVQ